MNPIYRYFRDVYLGVTTISIGMWVTFRHLFQRAVTVQYPHEKLTFPPRARSMLVNDIDACNGCQQCSRACPVDIIHLETAKGQPEDDMGFHPDGKARKLHVLIFDVEMSKCIFCGLCVEVCPTEAIHWQNLHEEVSYDRAGTLRRWAKYPPEEVKRLKERDEKIKAEKAKQAEAAAAAKAAAGAKADEKPAAKEKPEKIQSAGSTAKSPAKEPKPEDPGESPEKADGDGGKEEA